MDANKDSLDDAVEVEALSNDCSVVNIKEMVNKDKMQQIPDTVANELEILTENKE